MKKFPRLLAVIHLPPLAGSPGAVDYDPADALARAGQWAIQEAKVLLKAGFDGLILENFGDVPFYADRVPAETIASLSVIAAAVRSVTKAPVGINVLRNDANAGLSIASVTDLNFIRVNVLSGVAATDQGVIQGRAAQLLRKRDRLGSTVRIFADVLVKHARSMNEQDPELAVENAFQRAGADAVILSGASTGRPVEEDLLRLASRTGKRLNKPIYVGSGCQAETISGFLAHVHGCIVSSCLRQSGQAGARLDPKRIRTFVAAAKKKPTKRKVAKSSSRKPPKKSPKKLKRKK